MPLEKKKQTGLLIFMIALSLRLAYWYFLKTKYFFYGHPGADVLYYSEWAKEIAYHNFIGTKTFFGLPLYPYFLASLYKASFDNIEVVRFIHILLGSLNCVLIYKLASRIFSTPRTAILTGIICASNFILIYYDWLMMPVTLNIFLSIIILMLLTDHTREINSKKSLLIGLILGLSILGDGKMLVFSAILLIYFSIVAKMRKQKDFLAKKFLPLALGIFLVLFSVTLRNKIVGDSWIFISGQSGLSFYSGNNENATGTFTNDKRIRPTHKGQDEDQRIIAEKDLGRKLTSKEVSDYWKQKGVDFIKNNPKAYFKLLYKKLVLFISEDERSFDLDLIFQKNYKDLLDINPYNMIFPLALVGIFLLRRDNKGSQYAKFIILSQLAFTLLFFLSLRHRATILPFLIMFEAYAINWLVENMFKKQPKYVFLTFAFILFFIFITETKPMEANEVEFLKAARSGPIYEKQKDFESAQKEYLRALSIRPNDTNTLYNIANTYFYSEDNETAKKYYQKVLSIIPFHVDAMYNLGFIAAAEGKTEEALNIYKELNKLQPNSLDTLLQLSKLSSKINNCKDANYYFAKAAEIEPRALKLKHKFIKNCADSY